MKINELHVRIVLLAIHNHIPFYFISSHSLTQLEPAAIVFFYFYVIYNTDV